MRLQQLMSVAVMSMALCACAPAPQVRVDRDPAADLSSYKTFAFFEAGPLGRPFASLLGEHLEQATLAELTRRGYVYDPSSPDLKVALILLVAERADVQSTSAGPRPYRNRFGVETVRYKQGTLSIELVDARRNVAVWHGVADGRLDESALDDPRAAVTRVVGEVLAQLEPRS